MIKTNELFRGETVFMPSPMTQVVRDNKPNEPGHVVAMCWGEDSRKNAALFAAAPDLLAVAKRVLYAVRVGDKVRCDDLIAAIEKAERT